MGFSRLERAVIEAILSQEVDGLEAVRKQFAAASVVERDYTGAGFYTTISVPLSVPPMPDSKELRDILLDGACGRPKADPEHLVLFLLWTRAGYLDFLEGCTVGDAWPNEEDIEDIRPCWVRKLDHPRTG
ncbi:MAG: hypothetical protein NTZ17_21235 [Phycisphaerae bacterium]|nr:hypothetical protein [Phycisphaerae bacterium]